MNNIMLDLETLSVQENGLILQIAAIEFDPFASNNTLKDLLLNPSLNILVEIESQDRHIDDNTVAWWAKQPQKIQDVVFAEQGRISLDLALKQLSKFVWNKGRIWAQGTSFDISMIEHAYRQNGQSIPWEYWKARDSRTLLDLVEVDLPSATHDAVVDCARQAYGVQQALKKLNVNRFQR